MKLLACNVLFLFVLVTVSNAQVDPKWEIHDRNRPLPAVVVPGTASTPEAPGRPPSDAIILFDGKDLSRWVSKKDSSLAKWKVENGYFEVAPKTGDIGTKDAFSDCQLHAEFAEPNPPKGEDQDRGNSGVFLMGLYEIQVLDSYENKTYADGQASAAYGQYPPLVNASRPPGQQWRLPDGPLRNPSAGFLRKQNLCGWSSFRRLWSVSATGERFPATGAVAGLRHNFSRAAF